MSSDPRYATPIDSQLQEVGAGEVVQLQRCAKCLAPGLDQLNALASQPEEL